MERRRTKGIGYTVAVLVLLPATAGAFCSAPTDRFGRATTEELVKYTDCVAKEQRKDMEYWSQMELGTLKIRIEMLESKVQGLELELSRTRR